MAERNRFRIFILIVTIFAAACVSLNIGPKPAQKAKDVRYNEPSSPYAEKDVPDVDKTWSNSKNGNSISYKTNCNDSSDPSLSFLQKSLVEGIDEVKFLSSEKLTYNDREALISTTQGKVDGVATAMEFLIFKKNNCHYILSYVSKQQNFESDRGRFKEFINSFEVP